MTPSGQEAVVGQQPHDAKDQCPMDSDDYWLPACTHMSDDEDRTIARGQAFLQELSDVEPVPNFFGDAKVHAWIDGCEIRGRKSVVSQPVVGAQANNRAEVSAARAAMQRVPRSRELYSDSKWCVDIFSNLHMYKRRGWMAQGKKSVRHHDIWEDIYKIN